MERFVHNEYLIHLRKQVARTTDEVSTPTASDAVVQDESPRAVRLGNK